MKIKVGINGMGRIGRMIVRAIFESKNKNIEKAVCISNGEFSEIESREFVLCCGGIENSRILLWSKFKNKELFDEKLNIGKPI